MVLFFLALLGLSGKTFLHFLKKIQRFRDYLQGHLKKSINDNRTYNTETKEIPSKPKMSEEI